MHIQNWHIQKKKKYTSKRRNGSRVAEHVHINTLNVYGASSFYAFTEVSVFVTYVNSKRKKNTCLRVYQSIQNTKQQYEANNEHASQRARYKMIVDSFCVYTRFA